MDDKGLKKFAAAADFEQQEAEKAADAVDRAQEKVSRFEGLLEAVMAGADEAQQVANAQAERAAEAAAAYETALAQYREEHDGEPVLVFAQPASVGVKGAN